MKRIEYFCNKCGKPITSELFKPIIERLDRENDGLLFDDNEFDGEFNNLDIHLCTSCAYSLLNWVANLPEPEEEPEEAEEALEEEPVVEISPLASALEDALTEDIIAIDNEPEPKKKKKASTGSRPAMDYGKLAALLNAGWKAKDIMIEFGWSSHQSVANNKAKLKQDKNGWYFYEED